MKTDAENKRLALKNYPPINLFATKTVLMCVKAWTT